MEILQEFALRNIYCAPSEDRQFRFELVRVTKPEQPVMHRHHLYNRVIIEMPDNNNDWHLYNIGGIPSVMLNLKGGGCCSGNIEKWVNVEEDMNLRSYIFQMYNDKGVNLPRSEIYYLVTRENHLVFAIKMNQVNKKIFDMESFKYIRVYSNPYYADPSNSQAITVKSFLYQGAKDRQVINRFVESLPNRGKTLFYHNGYFSTTLTNNIAPDTIIEIFHDTGIIGINNYNVNSLRTFISKIDDVQKYLIHRTHKPTYIDYEDDLELYIVGKDGSPIDKGLYYYQNKSSALRNVTDKDFSLVTSYVNYHRDVLVKEKGTRPKDDYVCLISREPYFKRKLVYSDLKIHEFYKLPASKQLNVMLNSGPTIDEFRVEYFEASNYWKVAGLINLKELTPQLALDTVGYSAASYYYGNTPSVIDGILETPYIHAFGNFAYEYDKDGVLRKPIRHTEGTLYTPIDKDSKFVEFIQAPDLIDMSKGLVICKAGKDTVKINPDFEHIVYSTYYDPKGNRIDDWVDITKSKDVSIKNNILSVKSTNVEGRHFIVMYINSVYMRNVELTLMDYRSNITLMIDEHIGGLTRTRPADICFRNMELFLNGHRLIQGLDYFMDYPTINICNKSYIDYTKKEQDLHIRCTGVVLDKKLINNTETTGFINHGVLTRNKHYDIRDDRVFSIWVDGKLVDRNKMKFAENDTIVRIDNIDNGKPYVIAEKLVDLRPVSGLPTTKVYEHSMELNKSISDLYDLVFPEPKMNQFNVSRQRHLLYSPLVARVLEDMMRGIIPEEIYTREYQPQLTRNYLDEHYPFLVKYDPMVLDLPPDLTEIQPHYGNTPIGVDIFQYRFLYNMIKMLCNGDNTIVNLSGYLFINDAVSDVDKDHLYDIEKGKLTPFD